MKKLWGLAIALVAVAPMTLAQGSVGNVYGTVQDQQSARLPGASITLEGETGSRSTVADSKGSFRFLGLFSGQYKLTASLAGFANVTRNIQVTTGENVEVALSMKVSGVQETLEVVAATPLVDTKKRGTATTMTTEELENVPNARDPWAVLAAVPGVLVDRVNIAGSENGQQAGFAGKGTGRGDSSWNLDGLTITDMSATGASPTYFDFEAFNEINVTTGGNDLAVQSGGIGINLTTKRGTNKFHGGGRFLYADEGVSFGNVPSVLANDSRLVNPDGSRRDKANHIKNIKDYGFDFGGPIVKDKLWFYFTWGKQDIKLITLTGNPDNTLLPAFNGKLNWQTSGSTTVSAFWFLGLKQKFGRTAGFGVTPEDNFNWNQDNAYEDKVGGPNRPPGLYKLQVDHTFSPSFFMSANAAYYNTGFTLTPRGGTDKSFTIDYVRGQAIGSYIDYTAVRPQYHLNATGNYFFSGLGGNNELKFGFNYRDMTTTSITHYGGNQLVGIINSPTDMIAWVARDGPVKYGGKYTGFFAGDTLTKDRWTFNAGLRFDTQTAKNLASEAPANKSFPNVVPALKYGGGDTLIDWKNVSPRVGLSYALNNSRRTVLRASYAQYTDQLSFGGVTRENPSSYGFLAYRWNDANADRFVQPNEVNLGQFLYNVNIDPANPGAAGNTVNKIDRNLKPKKDNEVVVGVDHEIGGNFAVGVAYTWRRANDFNYDPRLAGQCTGSPTVSTCPTIPVSGYIRNAPSTSNGYTAFTFSPDPALVTAGGGGRLFTNANGYHTTFNGIEATLNKRLSNKWMARVALSWNSWKEYWNGTPFSLGADDGNPTRTENDPLENGGPVTYLSGGSGKASFYTNVPWQLYANALYQLPWGIDISTALIVKKGNPYPVSLRLSGGRDGTNSALATQQIDSLRYDNLVNWDLRLAKTVKLGTGGAGLTLAAEWFNVLNNDVVLSRYRYANSSLFTNASQGAISGRGRIEEIIAPSIFRLGARLSF